MGYSKIVSAAIKMSHITKLNTYVADGAGDILYQDEKITLPAYMPGAKKADIREFIYKVKKIKQLYSYMNAWGLFYLGYSFFDQKKMFFIVIGPYFEAAPNIYRLTMKYNLNGQQSADLRNIIENIKVLTSEQVSGYEIILQQFDVIAETETAPLAIYSDENNESNSEEKTKVDDELDLVKERYRLEKDFMHAVENGDKKAALKCVSSGNMLFAFSERFPTQPLRRLKNLTIILNTLLRVAARNSHVPAILIHRISEKFAFQIESGENIAALKKLQDHMIEAYCDLVKANDLKNYSLMTQKVIEHLMSFYDQPIDKKELANACHTHPGNLSRRFRKETGMTITAYQHNLQINQAKHLLKTENVPINEIAWMVGYEDVAYFGRVFKKTTGYSPSVYRG